MTDNRQAVVEALISQAFEVSYYKDRAELLSDLENPEWSESGFTDWRNQVFPSVQGLWDDLSLESRLAVFINASDDIRLSLDLRD